MPKPVSHFADTFKFTVNISYGKEAKKKMRF